MASTGRRTRSEASGHDPAAGTSGPNEALLRMMRRCPLFASLPATDLQGVFAMARERRVMRQETVFRQGDRSDAIYMLTQGRMKLLLGGPGGRGIILAFVDAGEAFGYLAPMAGTSRAHTAQAVMESSVLAWDAEILEDLLRRPALMRNALRLAARQIQDDWSRLHALVTEPVAHRLARALLQLASTDRHEKRPVVSIMQQDLAELIGTTPPTLSRILGAWETRGLVAAARERVVVRDPERLFRIAESDEPIGKAGRRRS